jgi:hypothetical protein
LFNVVIRISKLDSNYIPRKVEMTMRGNLGKTPKVNILGENKKHIQ